MQTQTLSTTVAIELPESDLIDALAVNGFDPAIQDRMVEIFVLGQKMRQDISLLLENHLIAETQAKLLSKFGDIYQFRRVLYTYYPQIHHDPENQHTYFIIDIEELRFGTKTKIRITLHPNAHTIELSGTPSDCTTLLKKLPASVGNYEEYQGVGLEFPFTKSPTFQFKRQSENLEELKLILQMILDSIRLAIHEIIHDIINQVPPSRLNLLELQILPTNPSHPSEPQSHLSAQPPSQTLDSDLPDPSLPPELPPIS